MRALPFLLCLALSAAGQSRDSAEACRAACTRYVTEQRLQLSVCGQCLVNPADRGAWIARLAVAPGAALTDSDWQVRWAVLKAQAKAAKTTPEQRLASWVGSNAEAERALACLTAVHVAGARKQTLDALFAEKSSEACRALLSTLDAQLALELYALQPFRRLEALEHAAHALGRSPARLVLDAMKERPESSDEIVAEVLVAAAVEGGAPVGLLLLREAKAADKPQVDRLLAIYARTRDTNRPLLASKEPDARRQALNALAPLAPLSQAELLLALQDPSPPLRLKAASALAAGEGRTFVEAAKARLEGQTAAGPAEKRTWLSLLAEVRDPACIPLAQRLWKDAAQPESVRGEALVSLAGCARGKALDDLETAAASPAPSLNAAAMRGAAQLPRELRATAVIEKGLSSSDAVVLAEAVRGAEAHRLTKSAQAVYQLTSHSSPEVRGAAIHALVQLDRTRAEDVCAACVARDVEAPVRLVCAEALAVVGSPRSAASLAQAARADPDAHVKFVAGESLRKLGLQAPPGSHQP